LQACGAQAQARAPAQRKARCHRGCVVCRIHARSLAACIKTALQLQGFDVGDAIAPQEALKPEAVEDIHRALAQLK
jgi:dihydrodipicolinate synthase/N-acetylneuraminate lyase